MSSVANVRFGPQTPLTHHSEVAAPHPPAAKKPPDWSVVPSATPLIEQNTTLQPKSPRNPRPTAFFPEGRSKSPHRLNLCPSRNGS